MVGSFLQGYQLSNEEVLALREGEVDDTFFVALEHVKEIHKNCKVQALTTVYLAQHVLHLWFSVCSHTSFLLLGVSLLLLSFTNGEPTQMLLRTHHQRAGLELMDVMAMHQVYILDINSLLQTPKKR